MDGIVAIVLWVFLGIIVITIIASTIIAMMIMPNQIGIIYNPPP